MLTTLNQIRAHSLCAFSFQKLMTSLGKTISDDQPVSVIAVLNSNGLDDALSCISTVSSHQKEIRLLAVWFSRQVQHLMIDSRSIEALDVAERFANGKANSQELEIARISAMEAAVTATQSGSGKFREAAGAAWRTTSFDAHSAVEKASEQAREAAAWDGNLDVVTAAQIAQLRKVCAECEVQVTA